ncbi:recombination protein RecT [Saccharopolyspora pogona]|uniref:recombination protein RecT n=1 Tax=Saccharopolyspora pogona TaxID=333966 RepID=UPI001686FBC4|nr:recombination protein RecT [Saccharopolyspora pogona]
MGNDLTRRVKEANPATNSGNQPAQQNGGGTLADQIRAMQPQFQMAMPKGAEAAQLIRDAMTCLRTTPALARCDAASVLGGLMTCAQLGLRPGVLGHAWLIPFGRQAQLVIGYQGLVELAHRSGQIKSLQARTVYENDTFDVDYGLADSLIHKPAMTGPKGKPVAYYAFAKFVTGGHAFVVMSYDEMETYRDQNAKSKTGPWKDHFEGMAHKTCVRQLAKWMPRSTEFATAIEADNTVRVDTSVNPDAALHGQHPDVIDGEIEPDETTTPDTGDQGLRPDDPDLTAHQQK